MITPICNVSPLKPVIISPEYKLVLKLNPKNRAKQVNIEIDGIKSFQIDENDLTISF